MFCPVCYSRELRVLDSRPYIELNQIRRRRQCSTCQYRFSTTEMLELGMPKVHKRNGSIVDFETSKVRQSIVRSVEKRDMSVGRLDQMIGRIVHRVNSLQVKHLSTKEIGCMIIDELKEVDGVAMIRYAAVFYAFEDELSLKRFIDDVGLGCQTSEVNER